MGKPYKQYSWPDGVPERFNPAFEGTLAKAATLPPPKWPGPCATMTVRHGTKLITAARTIIGKPKRPEWRLLEKRLLLSWILGDSPRRITRNDFALRLEEPIRLAIYEGRMNQANVLKQEFKRGRVGVHPPI